MTAPVIAAVEAGQIDPELVVDREMAAILLGVGASRVYDLQRDDKLPAEMTVADLVEYENTKGTFGRVTAPGGTRRYDAYLTDEVAEALREQGIRIDDPRAKEEERKLAREAKARDRLAEAGVTL